MISPIISFVFGFAAGAFIFSIIFTLRDGDSEQPEPLSNDAVIVEEKLDIRDLI